MPVYGYIFSPISTMNYTGTYLLQTIKAHRKVWHSFSGNFGTTLSVIFNYLNSVL